MRGKFIVIYGVNNLGKTTQVKLLAEKLNAEGKPAECVKYPFYEVEPAGKLINDYLRGGNPYEFSARELQLVHYIDRLYNQPAIKEKLDQGINIIAEDYFGTSLAWGLAHGIDIGLFKYLNQFIIQEDFAILLYGERFASGIEAVHHHERNEDLIAKAHAAHLQLADEYGWIKVDANRTVNEVHKEILGIVKEKC